MKNLLTALMLLQPVMVSVAHAEDIDDLDSDGKSKGKSNKEDTAKAPRSEVIREIERGFYMKSNLGATIFVLPPGAGGHGQGILSAGTQLGMAVGSDFIDQEKSSMAWEAAFTQGIHNGMNWETSASLVDDGLIPPQAAIQGDTRTYALTGAVEYSLYPSRRFGVGVRAGGGVMLTPLLMAPEAYNREVINGSSGFGFDLPVHRGPHPIGMGGLTFEYYTKLSHFSVGADIDAMYIVNFDLGISPTAYLKYSF